MLFSVILTFVLLFVLRVIFSIVIDNSFATFFVFLVFLLLIWLGLVLLIFVGVTFGFPIGYLINLSPVLTVGGAIAALLIRYLK